MGISDHFTCLLYEVQEAIVKTRNGITSPWLLNFVEQISQLLKIVYCLYTVTLMSPLTCVQSTSWEMPGWMKHKLESILPEEISLTSYMEMIPPLWQKTKWNLRDCWWKWKRRGKKTGLKLNIQKTKSMASSPITSWQIDGETMETVRLYFWGLQNHCKWLLQPWN